jgi:hypothetical protein
MIGHGIESSLPPVRADPPSSSQEKAKLGHAMSPCGSQLRAAGPGVGRQSARLTPEAASAGFCRWLSTVVVTFVTP